jgi:hypothetical protein
MYPVSACLLQNMCIYHSTYVARAERERERERGEEKREANQKKRGGFKKEKKKREREPAQKCTNVTRCHVTYTWHACDWNPF